MNSFERHVLQPAVLVALSRLSYWTGAVLPVERLFQAGRRRSPVELGKGTPDILGSVRWTLGGVVGAQWVALELKAPRLRAGWCCPVCCASKEEGQSCCGKRLLRLDALVEAGRVDDEQEELHNAWRAQGRDVVVVRTPYEAMVAVQTVAARLRAIGLEVG